MMHIYALGTTALVINAAMETARVRRVLKVELFVSFWPMCMQYIIPFYMFIFIINILGCAKEFRSML